MNFLVERNLSDNEATMNLSASERFCRVTRINILINGTGSRCSGAHTSPRIPL